MVIPVDDPSGPCRSETVHSPRGQDASNETSRRFPKRQGVSCGGVGMDGARRSSLIENELPELSETGAEYVGSAVVETPTRSIGRDFL